jgi:hypothetical protein
VDEIGKKFFNITENFSKFFGWEKFGHNLLIIRCPNIPIQGERRR